MIRRALRYCGFDVVRYPASPFARLSRAEERELVRLRSQPEGPVRTTAVFGRPFHIISGPAFTYLYSELIQREIYKFTALSDAPYIIDCGANVGVGLLYFKRLYPGARVVCFEPDADVFSVLERNVREFDFDDVHLINKGVWSEDANVPFQTDAQSTAGRIGRAAHGGETTVSVTRLSPYLQEPVDFLKLDVEGAESEVLKECAPALVNVRNIFVEYHSFDGQPQQLEAVLKALSGAGFRLHIESGGPMPRHPFESRQVHKGMDGMLNIFGYRTEASAR